MEADKEMFHFSGPNYDIPPVDLNDLSTYENIGGYEGKKGVNWVTMPFYDLHRLVWKELGSSLYYMQYHAPEIYKEYQDKPNNQNCQYAVVDKMCKWYVNNRKRLHPNNDENRLELMKFLYRFQDEVENQC